jgi:hypothetical protein
MGVLIDLFEGCPYRNTRQSFASTKAGSQGEVSSYVSHIAMILSSRLAAPILLARRAFSLQPDPFAKFARRGVSSTCACARVVGNTLRA